MERRKMLNEEEIRNSERLIILEAMGGDGYNLQAISRQELIKELADLSFNEYLSGMYRIIHHLYPKKRKLLDKIAQTKTTAQILDILDIVRDLASQ